jgi:hypothetical protein
MSRHTTSFFAVPGAVLGEKLRQCRFSLEGAPRLGRVRAAGKLAQDSLRFGLRLLNGHFREGSQLHPAISVPARLTT